ncbi:MAG TPA: SRPBCC domain-containing protein [Planctomycetota bacterium]|nr:SRPBCC domain-containing protein [Planctomycetota bacterium]
MFEILIDGPIEAVWHEITKTHEAQQAFFDTVLTTRGLAVGAPFQMRSRSGKYAGVVGEVLELVPPRRYGHTFRFTNFDDPPCKVYHELEEQGGRTLYRLRLVDLPAGTKTAKQMKQGAKLITGTLKAMVERGRPPLGTRLLFVLFRLLEPLSPKRCRVEHWPL